MASEQREHGEAPRVLPRGRNALPREVVSASQRGRIFAALTELVARDGYAGVSVAAVVARAGVSKPSFYEHFDSKENCILALMDDLEGELLNAIAGDLQLSDSNEQRIRQGLTGMVEFFASDIDRARVLLIEAPLSGSAGQQRVDQMHESLAALYSALREERRAVDPSIPPLSSVRAASIVGAVNEPLVKTLRGGGDAEALRGILDEIVDTVTLLATGHHAS